MRTAVVGGLDEARVVGVTDGSARRNRLRGVNVSDQKQECDAIELKL